MAAPLGIDQRVDVPLTVAVAAAHHRIMLQSAPTADPLVGTTLPVTHGSGVLVDGVPLDLASAAPLAVGDAVTLRVTFLDAHEAAAGSRVTHAVLLSRDDADAWHVQHSALLAIDADRPRFTATATRGADASVLIAILAESEAAASATIVADGIPSTHAWAGDRSTGGAKAWLVRAPAGTSGILVTVASAAGNTRSAPVAVPPRAPDALDDAPAWGLPPWLLSDAETLSTGEVAITPALLAAAAGARNEIGGVGSALNPTLATGPLLDAHGRVFGVTRFVGEPDHAYRWRVIAVPRSRHVSRDALEAHPSPSSTRPRRSLPRTYTSTAAGHLTGPGNLGGSALTCRPGNTTCSSACPHARRWRGCSRNSGACGRWVCGPAFSGRGTSRSASRTRCLALATPP
jgi:hypothetical protein